MAVVPGGAAASPETPDDVEVGREPTDRLVQAHAVEVAVVTLLLGGTAVLLIADRWLLAALLALCPIAAAAAVVDARTKRIPTGLTLAAAVVGVLGLGIAAAATDAWTAYVRALVAGIAVGLCYLAMWRFAAAGAGDVRLAAALGVFAGWSGWPTVVTFVVLAHLLLLPLALWRLIAKRRGDLPFGPALVAGVYLAVALVGLTA